jgi:hypothetical protein
MPVHSAAVTRGVDPHWHSDALADETLGDWCARTQPSYFSISGSGCSLPGAALFCRIYSLGLSDSVLAVGRSMNPCGCNPPSGKRSSSGRGFRGCFVVEREPFP